MPDNIKKQTARGLIWSGTEKFSVQAVQFVVYIIMANLLGPAAYGTAAYPAFFIAVSNSLIDSGFTQALIRYRDHTQTDCSTVFYFNVAIGLVLYAVLYFAAPGIATFFDEPILKEVTRVLCLILIVNSFVIVQRAILTQKLDFKTQAKATMSAVIVSGVVGITMAYKGYGVWAIVMQQLVNAFVTVVLLWIMVRWSPSPVFSKRSFDKLFSFGSKLMLAGILDTAYKRMYDLVIGKAFSATKLGLYNRAQNFADFPSSNLTGVLQRVTYPVLCEIDARDQGRAFQNICLKDKALNNIAGQEKSQKTSFIQEGSTLAEVYRKLLRVSAFVIFPLMLGLAAMAKPVILALLNPEWLFAATLLPLLCLAMMWYPIHALNLNLLQVKGRSDWFLKLEIIKKATGVAILFITLPMGLIAMCAGLIVNALVSLVINTYYTGKLINVGFLLQMRDLFPVLLLSSVMGGVVYAITLVIENAWLCLICGMAAGGGLYIGFAKILNFREWRDIVRLVGKEKIFTS